MSGSLLFTAGFAIVSVVVSASAIWRVARASGVTYKPLWMFGCLFGFVGFATTWSPAGDLYIQVGIQIPVVLIWTTGGGTILKTLFPVVAAVALVRFHQSGNPPEE
jgi:hypothetical protein